MQAGAHAPGRTPTSGQLEVGPPRDPGAAMAVHGSWGSPTFLAGVHPAPAASPTLSSFLLSWTDPVGCHRRPVQYGGFGT